MGIFYALIFIQNHTREECRSPSLQIREESCSSEAEAYSLQGLSFTFVLNADLTNAEKIFTRLIKSTSLAEALYNNTSPLFTKQHYRSLDYFSFNLS